MTTTSRSTARQFAVPAPSRATYLTMAALLVLLPLLSITLAAGSPEALARRALVVVPAVLVAGGILLLAMRRRRVDLADGVLTVKAAMYTHRVGCRELDLAHSRVSNLDERVELRPLLRTNGMGLPGFAAGHYRLRDLGKAFVLLTDRRRVLALRERSGRTLLLSLTQPQALLDALQEAGAH